MKEDMKKFLEAASSDEAVKSTVEALSAGKSSIEDVIAFAASRGFKLDMADFVDPSKKALTALNEDELAAVAGGDSLNKITSTCQCSGFGYGQTWELSCRCNNSGTGTNTTNGHWRCGCSGSGWGGA